MSHHSRAVAEFLRTVADSRIVVVGVHKLKYLNSGMSARFAHQSAGTESPPGRGGRQAAGALIGGEEGAADRRDGDARTPAAPLRSWMSARAGHGPGASLIEAEARLPSARAEPLEGYVSCSPLCMCMSRSRSLLRLTLTEP